MNKEILTKYIYKLADDQLIIGHRNSEWTGLGPVLEEDIAFSSIAQDKIGHAYQLYVILNEHLGQDIPDITAFTRDEKDFMSCQLVELPIGEYDFSLIRHFFHDYAELLRFTALSRSSFEPLASLSRKITGEIKYHIFHANTWVKDLAQATEESKARLQSAINYAYPYALGIFEEIKGEETLVEQGIIPAEITIKQDWIDSVGKFLSAQGLTVPALETVTPVLGGRYGYHSTYLQPMITEMTEVFRTDPEAIW
jgi:ring-1,2-phenylacetyl-CoA epoxidase subunit PaaC